MGPIWALAKKDLLLLVRDKAGLFWVLAFPLMFAMFFGSIFGDSGGGGRSSLKLAVIDEDESPESKLLIQKLDESDAVELRRQADDFPYDAETAREAVRKGHLTAYVRILDGYELQIYEMFEGKSDREPTLEVGLDPARQAEVGFLQGALMNASFGSVQELLLGESAETESTARLVRRVEVVRSRDGEPRKTFDVTFPQALVWGLMSVAMAFAIFTVRERASGTLLRLRIAPLSRVQLLGGRALACFLACMATMVIIEGIAFALFGVRFDHLGLLLLGMAATSVCFTGLMMTMSVMGKTEPAVAGAAWGLMMPFAMVGGGMIPLMAMPSWLASVSVVSPFKWAITAIEGAAWRGYDLADMWLPCSVLVAFGVGSFSIGVMVFRGIHD